MKIKMILGVLVIVALILAGCGADGTVSNVEAGTNYSVGDAGQVVQDAAPAVQDAGPASAGNLPQDGSLSADGTQGQPPANGQQGQLPAIGTQGQPPAGGQGQGDNGKPRPDLAAAAEILGISEEALRTALDNSSAGPGQGPPDFEAAAAELGIPVEDLVNALGVPADGLPPADGGVPGAGPSNDGSSGS